MADFGLDWDTEDYFGDDDIENSEDTPETIKYSDPSNIDHLNIIESSDGNNKNSPHYSSHTQNSELHQSDSKTNINITLDSQATPEPPINVIEKSQFSISTPFATNPNVQDLNEPMVQDHSKHLIVKEAMSQNLLPVLSFFYQNYGKVNSEKYLFPNHPLDSKIQNIDSKSSPIKSENLKIFNDNSTVYDISEKQNDTKDKKKASNSQEEKKSACNIEFKAPTLDEFQCWVHRLLLSPHTSIARETQLAVVHVGRELTFDNFHTNVVHGIILSLEKNSTYDEILKLNTRNEEMIVKPRGSLPLNDYEPKSGLEVSNDLSSVVEDDSSATTSNIFGQKVANLFGIINKSSDKDENNKIDVNPLLNFRLDSNLTNKDYPYSKKYIPHSESDKNENFLNTSNTIQRNVGLFDFSNDNANDSNSVNKKLIMLNLIFLIVEEYGSGLRPAVFIPVIERSCSDKSFEVRRDSAMVIGSLCKAVSTELGLEILFPAFVNLTNDGVWQVRKSAAIYSLPGLASVLSSRVESVNALESLFEKELSSARSSSWQFLPNRWNSYLDFNDKKQKSTSPSATLNSDSSPDIISGLSDKFASRIRGPSGWFSSKKLPLPAPSKTAALTPSFTTKKASSAESTDLARKNLKLSISPQNSINPSSHVSDRQWLQIIDKLASYKEPSKHVRVSVFEIIGKLFIAFANEPKLIEYLIELISAKVSKASNKWSGGRRSNVSAILAETDTGDYDDIYGDSIDLGGFSIPSKFSSKTNISGSGLSIFQGSSGSSQGIGHRSNSLWDSSDSDVKNSDITSKDALYHIAFNFPAILQAVGPCMWDKLRDTYIFLTKLDQFDIRYTLASSLHEIAKILSRGQLASVELTRALQTSLSKSNDSSLFLPDNLNNFKFNLNLASKVSKTRSDSHTLVSNLSSEIPNYSSDLEQTLCFFLLEGDEIKLRVLKKLSESMSMFPESSRNRCLPMILQVFKHDSKQWRTREIMASQVTELCNLFPPSISVSQLLPIAVEWANDPVAGVRASIAPAFSILFEKTKDDPDLQVIFFQKVIDFSHSKTFRGRVFFIQICSSLLAKSDENSSTDSVDFDQFFLPSLASLANDRVPNVRIALSRLVRKMLENKIRRLSVSSAIADTISFSSSRSSNTFSNKSSASDMIYGKDIKDISIPEVNLSNSSSHPIEAKGALSSINTETAQNISSFTSDLVSISDVGKEIPNANIFSERITKALRKTNSLPSLLLSESSDLTLSNFDSSCNNQPRRNSFTYNTNIETEINFMNEFETSKKLQVKKSLRSLEGKKEETLIKFDKETIKTHRKPESLDPVCLFPKVNEQLSPVESEDINTLKVQLTPNTSKGSFINNGALGLSQHNSKKPNHISFGLQPELKFNKKMGINNSSTMRSHLLISMIQTLSQDKDTDVQEQLKDIPCFGFSSLNYDDNSISSNNNNFNNDPIISNANRLLESSFQTPGIGDIDFSSLNTRSFDKGLENNIDFNLPTSDESSKNFPQGSPNDLTSSTQISNLVELISKLPEKNGFVDLISDNSKLSSDSTLLRPSSKISHRRSSSGHLSIEDLPIEISINLNKTPLTPNEKNSLPETLLIPSQKLSIEKPLPKTPLETIDSSPAIIIPNLPVPPKPAVTNAIFYSDSLQFNYNK
ncbi:Serine/threonine-protein phosphatase 4 regulatory subunit 1 [Smittium culicis]|uniref:Serine/threonine-protein phosphatase 4 regulatory subunit 1 n=1 Tax=Smittium culicis TaxID=133412 RepID=A0A1R1YFR2_9FUNG|nr:Serine/threonine-protein phosphatase 4 regulatory subunit 1 [Smittium culicis]